MGIKSEFASRWPKLPRRLRSMCHTQTLSSVSQETKERNACYLTGYLGALLDCGQISTDDYRWALSLVNEIHRFDHIAVLVRQEKKHEDQDK